MGLLGGIMRRARPFASVVGALFVLLVSVNALAQAGAAAPTAVVAAPPAAAAVPPGGAAAAVPPGAPAAPAAGAAAAVPAAPPQLLGVAEARCLAAFSSLKYPAPAGISNYCESLAVLLVATLTEPPRPQSAPTTAADVQPESPDTAGSQGTIGQASAAPRGTPVVFAGGTLALAGTEVGTQAVTSISLNPLSLIGDQNDKDEMAFMTRFSDVSVVLPFSMNEPSVPKDGIQFIGVRARFNFLAYSNGRAAVQALNKAYMDALPLQGQLMERVRDALKTADNPSECANAILGADEAAVDATCAGLRLTERGQLQAAEQAVTRVRNQVLVEADDSYFGLDFRADFGDQNLELEGKQNGTSLLTAGAFGRRLNLSHRYGAWLRGRLGSNYQDVDSRKKALFELDGMLGFALTGSPDSVGFDLEAALDGRYGNSKDLDVDTDFLELKLSAGVPFSGSSKLNFGITLPLAAGDGRDREPVMTVAIDWGVGLAKR